MATFKGATIGTEVLVDETIFWEIENALPMAKRR
jgi:hypothetical protein